MFSLPEILMDLTVVSVLVRLVLAMLCGGILGIERGKKRRPAGFRTYMLVCVGSTLVMLTNEFMMTRFPEIDPARMGAQVVSGIGFLGAGTIIVTGRNRVKGLTTAAGLWAAACIGLALGTGFYEGAVFGCVIIFFVMEFLHRLDTWVRSSTNVMNIYVEFDKMSDVAKFLNYTKDKEMRLTDLEVSGSRIGDDSGVSLLATVHKPAKLTHQDVITVLSEMEGIVFIEEI